mmetsp:Transcript_19335/g.23531  ORF Transcript_19335/g.23531 Transcript_19335/m.23531 type:complete len:136 (+) Transcript_19335:120-527(+)|eukprot:CAMPEP_0204828726 /NCGR_PEP_ID=MMETSP1346-20131115/6626_1 /ASSEMBLY_ACC=CAM_ASM_000771 /TAXON_ID=215587 /ORGANISM="Aplanochytrium stocchinoi, Strain GSBS06" /LENGTH=135 /DNA_ID=CAMNT_0051958013 /DNA_START=94 /DNA_END=501 /DNA_ORIENTATION=-
MFANARSLVRLGSGRYAVAAARPFSTVPINRVARVTRMALDGEEDVAAKVENQLVDFQKQLAGPNGPKGYVKTNRYLCKGEWVYELSLVFDSLENFKSYLESDFKKTVADPMQEEMLKSAKPGSWYEGARVYDEF